MSALRQRRGLPAPRWARPCPPRRAGLALAALALALLAGAALAAPAAEPGAGLLELESRPIFRFQVPLGSGLLAERVRAARERLEALPLDAATQPIVTQPVNLGDQRGHALLLGGRLLFVVLETDLEPGTAEGTGKAAAAAAERLAAALRARQDQRSIPLFLRAIGLSALATLALVLLLVAVFKLRRRSTGAVSAFAQRRASGLARKGFDPAPLIVAAARGLLQLAAWAVAVVLLDVWITFVLGRFPATAPLADALTSRVLGIVGGLALEALGAVPGLVAVAVIFLVTRALSSFLSGLFARVGAGTLAVPGLYPETVGATRRIAQAVLWLAALAAAYPYLPGSNSEAVKGLSLLLGVMVSLGSTGIMSQAMSGLVVIYSRSLAVGDSIRCGDVEGVVSEVGILSTKLITLRGAEVTLPNNVVVAGGVRNFSRLNHGEGALLSTTVTIGYDAPWRQVEALLVGAAARTGGLLAAVPPYVLQRSLADFYVTYDLVARLANPVDRPQVLSELHGHIQDAFNEAGVQIMSPHYVLQPDSPVLGRAPGPGSPPGGGTGTRSRFPPDSG